jgi:hypothetical protein
MYTAKVANIVAITDLAISLLSRGSPTSCSKKPRSIPQENRTLQAALLTHKLENADAQKHGVTFL